MRLSCGLALALWLSSPAAAWRQQEPSAPAVSAQPPDPLSPSENPTAQPLPPDTTLTPEQQKELVLLVKKPAHAAAARARKKPRTHVPAPPGTPRKIVVREGGASEPAAQIAPGMTPAEAASERQIAEQLLGSTDIRLKDLAARALDAQQQETVDQIRNYMSGARAALKEGDVRRAETLAQKAQLLAEDLLKR